MISRTIGLVGVAAATLILGGCASLQAIDSEVSTYSQWPADRKPSSYVFERLPSQQAQPQQQDQLEALARGAVAKAGFTPAPIGQPADVTVQLGARVTRSDPSPWDSPMWGGWGGYGYGGFGPRWHGGLGIGYGGWGPGWGPGWGGGYYGGTSWYDREVAVLIRDGKTGQPLYETRARNDSAYNGDGAWIAAMFDAALKDFPTPAISPRNVRVALPQP